MAAKLKEGEVVRRRWGSRVTGTVSFVYGMGRVRVDWDPESPGAKGTRTTIETRLLDRVDPDAAPTLDDQFTAVPVADETRQRVSGYGFDAADTFGPRRGATLDAVRSKAFTTLCTATMAGDHDLALIMENLLFAIDHNGDDQYDAPYDDAYRRAYHTNVTFDAYKSIRAQHPEWSP